MDSSRLDYDLPPELIAQHPLPRRDSSRLLLVDRDTARLAHHAFNDLPRLLASGDLLVRNVSRVRPARLRGLSRATGGAVEALFLRELKPGRWQVLLKPTRRLKPGEKLTLPHSGGHLEILRLEGRGAAEIASADAEGLRLLLDKHGEVPLPPYIRREATAEDEARYQTVYARNSGSVAAPTAGLHFTDELLRALDAHHVKLCDLTLDIGLGTFQPIQTARIEDHPMHVEEMEIAQATAELVEQALAQGRRVIPVGTSSLRALESAWDGRRLRTEQDSTDLYIRPGYRFAVAGALLTNFHAPRSTLLALVMAMAGEELMREAYRVAVEERYRFLSYGDAMLIV